MFRSIARYVIKDFVKGYFDLVSIVVMLVGFGCFVLATILAIFDEPRFAILFIVLGALFILLGYAGAKLFERLVDKV